MGWMAVCDEHFEQMMKDVQEKHPDHNIGWSDSFTPDQFDNTEEDQEMLKEYHCDYPGCNRYPDKEVIWFEPMTEDDLKSSKYISLE